MLQNLADHIRACVENAAKAEQRAAETTDPNLKTDYIALAAQWAHLARSYEFAESLERFLLDSQKAKDALRPRPPEK
ncbi:MAG TPA: hypothetical protein VGN55_09845 [Xanthobacteraceae bacterium]